MENEQIWAPLAQGRHARRYDPGQFIYLQNTTPGEFYYLEKGVARSFISSPEGVERLLTLHHAGDLMGEASFFDGCPRVSSAVAVTECWAISVDAPGLEQVFRAHPELAFPMLRYLARTVRLLSGHVDDITFRPADRRLAGALLRQTGENDLLRTTHEELGSAVGASRVTVSRILSRFVTCGWIETGYGSLHILDRSALERFAEGGEKL